MPAAPKQIITVPVRELVEFALRTGDLGGRQEFVSPRRALEGTRGHQRLQRSRPTGYQKEVAVAYELDAGDFILRVQGRIDGVLAAAGEVVVEEIKTVAGPWDGLADPLHWAQAKIYASIYAQQQELQTISVRLTYLELRSGKVTQLAEQYSTPELAAFFQNTTAFYLEWLHDLVRWREQRDQSIRTLDFPFGRYRRGQRELAVAVYRAITQGKCLFAEAPTGIGKTVSVLFPSVKAMGEGKLERIYYLTARTTGQAAAELGFDELRRAGLRLRTLTISAKEKLCLQAGAPCDPQTCPLARGYYDRRKLAMREALAGERITRRLLEQIAQRHSVCPFELSLDLIRWVDAVVCDYNYAFDPKAYLRREFSEATAACLFLVDEAHNLVDRGREMFSAVLDSSGLRPLARALKERAPDCARALRKLHSVLRNVADQTALCHGADLRTAGDDPDDLFAFKSNPAPAPSASGLDYTAGTEVLRELPPVLVSAVEKAFEEAETWLALNQEAEFRADLLELYFNLFSFGRVAESYNQAYRALIRTTPHLAVELFCLDPSTFLKIGLDRAEAAVLFSATLSPLEYYRELLGGGADDPVLQLDSPFAPENLSVLVQADIRTTFKARGETLAAVGEAIQTFVQQRPGNYLAYFPSYEYLANVCRLFKDHAATLEVLVQRPGMDDADREMFLAAFRAPPGEVTRVGFAVLGGIFGEGIDLVGECLIGAVIVGVGLPQLSVKRDLIRDYFQDKGGCGFNYAYMFPGMNRVLQATGRVIRSENDLGAVLLIDSRFSERRYQRLFPRHWKARRIRSSAQLQQILREFWRSALSLPDQE